MSRSTQREIATLNQWLEDAAGSKDLAIVALTKCRKAVGASVIVGPYKDGCWSAVWVENEGHDAVTRCIPLHVEAIVDGSAAAMIQDYRAAKLLLEDAASEADTLVEA